MTSTAASPRCRGSQARLRDPDPVLAGDRAAQRERGLEQLVACRLEPRDGRRLVLVPVEDEGRMQVAVAGMPERPIRSRGAPRSARSPRASPARGCAARRRPPSARRPSARARGSASRRPWRSQSASCASAARITDVAPAASHTGTAASSSVDRRGAGQVGLDEQHRGRVAVETEAEHVVDGADRELVESSSVTGPRPAAVEPGDRLARPPTSVGKKASNVDRGGGAGRRRSVASVMIASVPWRPTRSGISP